MAGSPAPLSGTQRRGFPAAVRLTSASSPRFWARCLQSPEVQALLKMGLLMFPLARNKFKGLPHTSLTMQTSGGEGASSHLCFSLLLHFYLVEQIFLFFVLEAYNTHRGASQGPHGSGVQSPSGWLLCGLCPCLELGSPPKLLCLLLVTLRSPCPHWQSSGVHTRLLEAARLPSMTLPQPRTQQQHPAKRHQNSSPQRSLRCLLGSSWSRLHSRFIR